MIGLGEAVFTLGRGMFGVGVLTMPYMFTLTGECWGVLLLIAFAANATTMSTVLLVAAPTCSSYEEAVRESYGIIGEKFLAVNILLANLGTCAAYLQIAADRLVGAFCFWGLRGILIQRHWVIILCSLSALPFTLKGQLHGARWTTLMSFAIAGAVTIAIVFVSASTSPDSARSVDASRSVLAGVPLSCYAFSAMSQVYPVYAELSPSMRKPSTMALAAAIASVVSGLLYGLIGIVASHRFGSDTQVDVLRNFEQTDALLFHVLGVAFALSCLLGVPLMLFPARRSFNFVIQGADAVRVSTLAAESVALIAVACAITFASKTVLPILDVVGSLSAIAVDVVLPGSMFLRRRCLTMAHTTQTDGIELPFILDRQQGGKERCRILCECCCIGVVVLVGFAMGVVSFAHSVDTKFDVSR